jgi:hypothetical protein
MHPSDLPRPDASALAASRALLDRIAADLAAHGNWMSFAGYMRIALHEPGLGYYNSKNPSSVPPAISRPRRKCHRSLRARSRARSRSCWNRETRFLKLAPGAARSRRS